MLLMFGLFATVSNAQTDSAATVADTNTYRIVTTTGDEFVCKIISSDKREVLIRTEDNREFYIPQFQVKEIYEVNNTEYNAEGKWVGEDKFATRYFITTNGLPMKKGEHYIQWNVFGPDFQFAVGDNFGIGVMTTWIGSPMIITSKYSFQLGEKAHMGVGLLAGSGTWLAPEFGGLLPFASLSFGTRRSNIAFSGGYGAVWSGWGGADGRALVSVAGMTKVAPRVSLVFDSFVLLPNTRTHTYQEYDWQTETYYEVTKSYQTDMIALFTPGVRWHLKEGSSFQFGLTGVVYDDFLVPAPIPTFQWYKSF